MSPSRKEETPFGSQLLSYFSFFWLVSFASILNWFPNRKALKKPVQECGRERTPLASPKYDGQVKVKTIDKKSNNTVNIKITKSKIHVSVSEDINNNAECKLGITAVKKGEIINGQKHSKDAVENTISVYSDELVFNTSSTCIQSADMMKPELLGLNGQDKNGSGTTVQGQGGSEQSSSSQQNPSGTQAYSPSERNHCGMVNGGSDGDGNEPSNTNTMPSGHYQETPVPVQPEQDKNAVGLQKSDSSDGNQLDVPTFQNNDMNADGSGVTFAQDGNTSYIAHPLMAVMVPNVLLNPHLSDQACYVSKSNGVLPSKTQPRKTKSLQKILYPFHKQVLSVDKDGRYEENRDFKISNIVGRGAYGQCASCQDRKTGIYFVRKEVKKRGFYRNEINIWRKINNSLEMNQNIVRLLGAYEGEEHMSMFMEHMSGTLNDIAGILTLSEEEIYSVLKPVLQGMDYIHDRNIVHGDITCTNLFYNVNTFEIKIGDFGLSEILHELSVQHRHPHGTVRSMAPEVCRSEPYGRSADIWSFGCVSYHLITGCAPWSEDEIEASIIYKVGHGSSPEIPPYCSDGMKEMLNNMFRLNKTERPTAKELLRHTTFASIPDDDEVLYNWFYRISENSQPQPSLTAEETASPLSAEHQIMDDSSSPMSLSGQHDLIHSYGPQFETVSDAGANPGSAKVNTEEIMEEDYASMIPAKFAANDV